MSFYDGKSALEEGNNCNFDTNWLSKSAKVREVTIRKDARAHFGAFFAPVGKYLYIIRVDKFAELKLSAAYRAGFKFGDRLNTVNGTSVDSNTDLDQLQATLKNSTVVTIEIDERPVIAKVAEVTGDQLFGIEFDENCILNVHPGTVCDKAGFSKGDTIIQVNDRSVLGLTDMEIFRICSEERMTNGKVSIMAIRAPLAAQLRVGCEYFMAVLGIKNLPAHIFVNQTLRLDCEDDKKIERVVIKETKYNKHGKFLTVPPPCYDLNCTGTACPTFTPNTPVPTPRVSSMATVSPANMSEAASDHPRALPTSSSVGSLPLRPQLFEMASATMDARTTNASTQAIVSTTESEEAAAGVRVGKGKKAPRNVSGSSSQKLVSFGSRRIQFPPMAFML